MVVYQDAAVMLPHLWVASIAQTDLVEQLLGVDLAPNFWEELNSQDPRLLARGGHPALSVEGYTRNCIPLWLHGDGVEYSQEQSLMTLTFGSCLATTNSMDSMFYIASFVKSVTATTAKHGVDTWVELWAIICWSFQALWEGTHPTS